MDVKRTPLKSMSAKQAAKVGRKVFSTLPAPAKPLRPVNPEREAKRRSSRKKHHAAYRASETFTVVERRAAGQCEGSLRWVRVGQSLELAEISDGREWEAHGRWVRCTETEQLEHHHVRYPDEPGTETPDDMCVLGQRCHAWVERVKHPTRKNGR